MLVVNSLGFWSSASARHACLLTRASAGFVDKALTLPLAGPYEYDGMPLCPYTAESQKCACVSDVMGRLTSSVPHYPFQDLAVATTIAICMSLAGPWTELSPERPQFRLLRLEVVCSVVYQIALITVFQVLSLVTL